MSEQVARSCQSHSAPTLCMGDFFNKRWDWKDCLPRAVSVVSWTSRLGADVFHLGGLLMAVCRKQSGRWCVGGDLSECSRLQSASPAHPLGLWRLRRVFVQEPQWISGDSGSW